ncbi:MAG: hypothetical protein EKK57_09425 [Proteobacteria bacterium]|nr:MAG: hypothetical protein EKK57_09425 [Pseudomonadota bacterium]
MKQKLKRIEPSKKWTFFWDMHSGGSLKLKWHYIIVNLPQGEAIRYFKDNFGRDPYNVTCDCCGEDYSIMDYSSFEEAAKFHLRKGELLDDFKDREDVLVIEQ